MKSYIIKPAILLSAVIFVTGCGPADEGPLLSLLTNNRMMVLLKGTYASDRPLEFSQINNNQLFIDDDNTDPAVEPIDSEGVPAYSNLDFFLDFGEIRLSTKSYLSNLYDITSESDAEDFWDVVSTERQVYCSRLYSFEPDNEACIDSGGLVQFVEFFNGAGAIYPSRDVGPGTYTHAGVFMRGVFTGFQKQDGVRQTGFFDNNEIFGADVMPLLNYDPGIDLAQKAALPPQFFPLHHITYPGQQNYMTVGNGFVPLVLEIRFNLKENLMLHSYSVQGDNPRTVVTMSDWRKPHDGQINMGGNVLTRARMYYPDYTSTIRISGGTESTRHYYALYIENECLDPAGSFVCNRDQDTLPTAATPVRNGNDNTLANIPEGNYVLQCRYDSRHDGYPEVVLAEIPVYVPTKGGTIDIACACGNSTSTGCN